MIRANRWNLLAALALLLCGIAAGCGSPSAARRLALAEDTIDTNPDSALAILRSIPSSRLRGEQRALHALLSVKATDRAFIPHRSDSAAAIALDYYGDRPDGLRTAEAHYYAGRVAYDLTDYPRALKAFHLALRSIEETPDNSTRALKLKSAIVSQQAQLLTRLRLFNEARLFYREAIKSDSILGETSFMFYDISDLAFTYIEEHNTDSARIILNRALPVCHGVVPEADTELYSLLALSYLKDKQYARAAEFIDSIDPYIEHGDRSLTLSIVAQIYDKIGRMDSAVHFAKILSDNPEFNLNKFAGHRILAKNSLRSGDIDTIAAYHDSLAQFSVKMLDQHALGLNLPGTMFYRLMTTELDNSRLQTRNDTLALSVYALALLAAIIIFVVVIKIKNNRIRHTRQLLEKEWIIRDVLQENASARDRILSMTADLSRLHTELDTIREEYSALSSSYQTLLTADNAEELTAVVDEITGSLRDLCARYQRTSSTDTVAIGRIMQDIRALLTPDTIRSLEKYVDTLFDGLAGRSRKAGVSDKELLLLCLFSLGFSNAEIALLTGNTYSSVSTKKSRLLSRLVKEGILTPDVRRRIS